MMEKLLIEKFNKNFDKQKSIGNEYFKGNYKDMIKVICNYIGMND